MKFIANTSLLSEALDKVKGVANNKSPLEATKHLLFEARGNTLTISATDTELFSTVSIPCEVVESGALCLQAKRLDALVRNLKTDEVTIQREDNDWAMLRAGKSRSRIVGLHADLFPQKPEIDLSESFRVDTAELQNMIAKTLFCVSVDNARANLTGANLSVRDEKLTMVGTDGTRLAKIDSSEAVELYELPEALNGSGIIIPRKALIEIKRAFNHRATPDINAVVRDDRLTLYSENFTLTTILVAGTFPDFTQVLPRESEQRATVSREELLDAVKFVSLTASPKTYIVRLTLSEDSIEMYGSDPEAGESMRNVGADYCGPEVKVGINYTYLQDALGVIDGDGVTMEVIDSLSPILIRDTAEDGLLLLVMPMRL